MAPLKLLRHMGIPATTARHLEFIARKLDMSDEELRELVMDSIAKRPDASAPPVSSIFRYEVGRTMDEKEGIKPK